ncbi:pectinesterase inhibitor 10-like protein [Tanacetum coccineum]
MTRSYSINSLALIILLLSFSINLISALEKTSLEFIRTSCGLTTYPTLCFNSLSSKAGAIQTSPKLLAQTALSVSLDTTITTSSSMVKLSQVHGMAPRQIAAMKDCMELLSDSVYQMKKSLVEMNRPGSKDFGLVMSDIQTWISSALTDEDTCSEGFANDPKMKNVVRGKIVNVVHLTSNALGCSHERLHGVADRLYVPDEKITWRDEYRPGSKDSGLVMSDIQTWVSAALTDEDTCSEGSANDPKMKNVVRGKVVNVVHLTSNALGLINIIFLFTNSSRKVEINAKTLFVQCVNVWEKFMNNNDGEAYEEHDVDEDEDEDDLEEDSERKLDAMTETLDPCLS